MAGGFRVAISPVPLGKVLDLEVPALAGNPNLENRPTVFVHFGRKYKTVPVLLGWFDNDAGQIRQPFRVFDPYLCVDHRVDSNGEWKRRGRCVAVSEEGPGGKHHTIGGQHPTGGGDLDAGVHFSDSGDHLVVHLPPCSSKGHTLGPYIRSGVKMPSTIRLKQAIKASRGAKTGKHPGELCCRVTNTPQVEPLPATR